MKLLKTLILLSLITLAEMGTAQDIHFSQFDMSPLTLNPALTGAFLGTFRIGGIYRDQWRGLKSNYSNIDNIYGIEDKPYTTPSLYVDIPLLKGLGKYDWIGAGAVFYRDRSGGIALTNQGFLFSAAYHLGLDKKGKTHLTLGLQGGYLNVSSVSADEMTDTRTGVLGNEVSRYFEPDPMAFSPPTGPIDGMQDNNAPDFNLGLTLTSKLGKKSKSDLMLGFSINHLLRPKLGLYSPPTTTPTPNPNPTPDPENNSNYKVPIRSNIHGKLNIFLTEKWSVSPAFMVNIMAKQREIAAQALMGYKLNPKDDFKINFGLGYRLADAPIFIAGIDYKSIRFGAAYDMTLSGVQDIEGVANAWEIALSYIAKISKDPDVPPAILCPRF